MSLGKLVLCILVIALTSNLCVARAASQPKTCPKTSSQSSRTLAPQVIQAASFSNGTPTGNQSASLTSKNNFINFCASENALGAHLMNGTQSTDTFTCNSIPMGMIVAPQQMPSCKFKKPANLDRVKAFVDFPIVLQIKNMVTGHFVNPNESYYAAPQQLSRDTKEVIGHAHIVAQRIESLTSTAVLDPRKFAFFKGLDTPVGKDGTGTITVTGGLAPGVYRLATILAAANHQPVLAGVAQRGTFDDVVYFTVE